MGEKERKRKKGIIGLDVKMSSAQAKFWAFGYLFRVYLNLKVIQILIKYGARVWDLEEDLFSFENISRFE